MGFYELGNGCDSCDTVSSILPNNMQMDSNSAMGGGMMSPYGAQANTVKQYTNSVSSGYVHNGSNMGMMGNGSNGSTMGATTMTTTVPTTIVQTIPTVIQQQQKQVKQVVVPTASMVMVSANNNSNSIEGFADSNSSMNSFIDYKKWIILGLVIFSALASNECCKYFLNKSLQLNDGSPMYYLAYAVVAILLSFAAYTYASKN